MFPINDSITIINSVTFNSNKSKLNYVERNYFSIETGGEHF